MTGVIANRYAEALFQLGKEKELSETFVEECRVIRDVFENDDQLNAFLMHPGVTHSKKKQFLDDVLKSVSHDVLNMVKLLVERHRTEMISDVMKAYIQLDNEDKGILPATVYSVRELSDSEIAKLEDILAKRFDKNEMLLENRVDPSIIGGVKIRVGNTIYDGSISAKLQRIERDIISANN